LFSCQTKSCKNVSILFEIMSVFTIKIIIRCTIILKTNRVIIHLYPFNRLRWFYFNIFSSSRVTFVSFSLFTDAAVVTSDSQRGFVWDQYSIVHSSLLFFSKKKILQVVIINWTFRDDEMRVGYCTPNNKNNNGLRYTAYMSILLLL